MTLFNSSRFLCWSMPSIGVTTTSPKNSLSFNMSPTSAIIFIKCQNGCQMKIIFLIREDNNSQRCYFAWENLRGGFCDVGCCCSFIVVAVLHSFLFFICGCSSFTFAFWHSSLTLPWTIDGFLHPFYNFALAYIPEWFASLSFSIIPLSSCRGHYGFDWAFFYPWALFVLRSFIGILFSV